MEKAGMNGVNGGGGYAPQPRYREQQKATLSGATALVGVVALIVNIIAVAVPNWGSYSPYGAGYYQSGKGQYLKMAPEGHQLTRK